MRSACLFLSSPLHLFLRSPLFLSAALQALFFSDMAATLASLGTSAIGGSWRCSRETKQDPPGSVQIRAGTKWFFNLHSKEFSSAHAACAVLLTCIKGVRISGITGNFETWLMASQKNILGAISRREEMCWAGSGSAWLCLSNSFHRNGDHKPCRVRTSQDFLWNFPNCWYVIHTARGSSQRIKDLKKMETQGLIFFF